MYFKKHLIFSLQRIRYHFKGIKFLILVPILFTFAVIPALNFFSVEKFGRSPEAVCEILRIAFMFFPFLSVWCTLFFLKEYLEADGHELLYVCRSKLKLVDSLYPFLLYCILISAFFGGYQFVFHGMTIEWGSMLCVCVFYFGLVYFLLFLTKSITITLMVLLLYTLANIIFLTGEPFFPFYYYYQPFSSSLFFKVYLPLAGLGCVLTAIGCFCNYKMKRFD